MHGACRIAADRPAGGTVTDGGSYDQITTLGKLVDKSFGNEGITAVSGMGLMIGIKTVKTAAEVVKTAMQNGVLCLTAKDKVRLLPALNIPFEDLKKAIEIIKEAAAV